MSVTPLPFGVGPEDGYGSQLGIAADVAPSQLFNQDLLEGLRSHGSSLSSLLRPGRVLGGAAVVQVVPTVAVEAVTSRRSARC
jgi:hypothetical protein